MAVRLGQCDLPSQHLMCPEPSMYDTHMLLCAHTNTNIKLCIMHYISPKMTLLMIPIILMMYVYPDVLMHYQIKKSDVYYSCSPAVLQWIECLCLVSFALLVLKHRFQKAKVNSPRMSKMRWTNQFSLSAIPDLMNCCFN